MTQRKIGNSWWVDITHQKVRYRKKSPDNSKSGAQAYEATLRRRLAEGGSIEEIEKRKKHAQSFSSFSQFWFKTHVEVNNKPSMVAKTRGILKNRLVPFFGSLALNEITTLQVEQYKAMLAGRGLANKTINGELTVLGKCLRDAKRWLDLDNLPEIVLLKVPPSDFDFLTEGESERLLSELSGNWFDITYVALKTGLRMGELQALQWQDVYFQSNTLVVKRSRCSVACDFLSPKGNKTRPIPLSKDVVKLLSQRRKEQGLVFGVGERVFRAQRLNSELANACARAKMRKVTCHVLRHSYASHLAMKGIPIVTIQRLLGHTDIKVTMRYAHLSSESVDQVAKVLGRPLSSSLEDEDSSMEVASVARRDAA